MKQKSHYDQRHASAKYHLGDLVLLKNMRNLSRASGKTDKRWFGPYTIVKIHDKELLVSRTRVMERYLLEEYMVTGRQLSTSAIHMTSLV